MTDLPKSHLPGANKPPPVADPAIITEDLKAKYKDLIERAGRFAASLAKMKTDTPEARETALDFAKQIRAAVKEIEEGRQKERQPFADSVASVDAFFASLATQAASAKTGADDRLKVALPEGTSRTGRGSIGIKRSTTTFEIEDASKVPRKYCSPDMAKIRAGYEADKKQIPGVLIGLNTSLTVR